MAEAFTRMHAADGVEAASSGPRPSGRVNPRAIECMREVGYDLSIHTSKSLDQFNGREVEVAVRARLRRSPRPTQRGPRRPRPR